MCQLEEGKKTEQNNDGERDWEDVEKDGVHRVREWRERAENAAAGIGLTF